MNVKTLLALAAVTGLAGAAPAAAPGGPTDAQIAHIAYTAGAIDVAAARQALEKSHNRAVREFAKEMARDHGAVNAKAMALLKKLKVTPEANPTSAALSKAAEDKLRSMAALRGADFDRAYVRNEAAYHQTVNQALAGTLIPSADNAELRSLLETGLTLFREHQAHAEHLEAGLK